MAKKINIGFDGKEYTLTYTRNSIKQMESAGFDISEATKSPLTSIEMLFSGAFLAHKYRLTDEEIKTIWAGIENKDLMIEKLIEMYNEPLTALMDEPGETTKKASWKADF